MGPFPRHLRSHLVRITFPSWTSRSDLSSSSITRHVMPSKRSGVLFPAVFRRFFRPLLGAKAPSYSSVLHFFCMADGGQADTLIYKLTHVRVCVCILAKGCPPVRPVYPCPSIFRLILTSSNGRSYTIHPRIRVLPMRLL